MKKVVLLSLVLLLLPFALASSMTVEPIKDKISPFDTAEFLVTINNTGIADKFVLSYDDLDWAISTDPLTHYTTGMFINAASVLQTTLIVKPTRKDDAVFKKHSLEIVATSSKTGEKLSSIINIDVRKDLIVYNFDVDIEFMMPDQIFPVRTNSVKVRLKNNNPLNITKLDIFVESSLFNKSTFVELSPNSEKIIDFPITLDTLLPPQEDTVTLRVFRDGQLIKSVTEKYSVVPYGKFVSREESRKKFLGEERTITFTNTGNSEQTGEILVNAGSKLKRLFSSTVPSTQVRRIDDVAYYTSTITLENQASKTFTVKTSYLPIFYVIIILIVLGILYLAYRTPVIIQKEAKEVAIEEGGIARLSVVIKMKNRSNRQLKKVVVVERIPNIAKVQIKASETLKPAKHYNYKDGMVMEYHIGRMEPGEIRFITYQLKTKLAVVGDLRLRPVIVQYDGKKTYSNSVTVYTP